MGLLKQDSSSVEDIYFIVKQNHCLGHNEPRTITVRAYRNEQSVEKYDEMNRVWRDLVLKKRSAGPTFGVPSPRGMELFDMCSYDMDNFRDFVQAERVRSMCDVEDAELAKLLESEDALFSFAMRFLRRVLFGEHSIPLSKARVSVALLSAKTIGKNIVSKRLKEFASGKVMARTKGELWCERLTIN